MGWDIQGIQVGRCLCIPAELVAQEVQLALCDNGDKWFSAHFGVYLISGNSVSVLDVMHDMVTCRSEL